MRSSLLLTWLTALALTVVASCSSGTTSEVEPVGSSSPSAPSSSPSVSSPSTTPTTNPTPTSTADGADPSAAGTTPTSAAASSDDGAGAVTPEGFESVAATIVDEAGEVCEVCVWLADTNDLRARGLMFVTDLGGADGMAFVYPAPHSGTFWMRNTVTPLSIAFFAADGAFLDAFDMEPCTADPCLQYATPRDFTVAIEVFQGGLGGIGAGPGSRLELTDLPCDPAA